MKFSQSDSPHNNRVHSYTEQSISIARQTYYHSLIVTAEQIFHPWPVPSFQALDESLLQLALPYKKEIWLLGTGNRQHLHNQVLRKLVAEHQIGLEIMSTPAACRTFNLLLAEGRDVAALLIIEKSPSVQEAIKIMPI